MAGTGEQKTVWNGMALSQGVNRLALAWAWEQGPRLVQLGMRGSERDALMALAAHTKLDGGNDAWPSHAAIVRMSVSKRAAIIEALARLEEAGIISRDACPPRSTRYRITPETDTHTWSSIGQIPDSLKNGRSRKRTIRNSDGDSPDSGVSIVRNSDGDSPDSGHEQEKGTGVVEQEKGTSEPTAGRSVDSIKPVQEFAQELIPDDWDDAESIPVQSKAAPVKPKNRKPPLTHISVQRMPNLANAKPADPSEELAVWFHQLIGEPAREEKAARTEWARTFRPLVDRYGAETVKAVITWASLSEFWAEKLRRKSGDSAEYLLDKFPTWSDQRADKSERAMKEKPQGSSSPAQPTTPRRQLSIDPTR